MSKVVTQFYRGKVIESIHNIKCYIGSTNGRVIFSTGNENDYIYPRSSIKIFQAIPFALSNGFDVYNLNKKQIALSCSSHCGENFHINELENWIKKIKLKPTNLQCGIHNPLDKKSSEKFLLSGSKRNQLLNNCAGKHLAMLSNCLVNKFNIQNYLDFNHPHQKKIRDIFTIFTESKILTKSYGIDGCSAPQYAFKIKELSTALINLFKSYNFKFEFSEQVKRMINSILQNPLYIGGTNNLDSNLIKISKNKIFCKGGAEGVFLFLNLKKEIFGIIKVADGNERALPAATYKLFKKFSILSIEELNNFKKWNNLNIYNHAKQKVGNINTIIE